MQKTLLIILLAALAVGCQKKSTEVLTKSESSEVTNINTKEQLRDTLLKVPGSEIGITGVPVGLDLTGLPYTDLITISDGRSTLNMQIKDGKLSGKCICDTASIVAQVKDTYKETTTAKKTENSQQTTETIIKYKIPKWAIWYMVAGTVGWLIILISLYLKFKPI